MLVYLICVVKFEAKLCNIILILSAKILKEFDSSSLIVIKDLYILKRNLHFDMYAFVIFRCQ